MGQSAIAPSSWHVASVTQGLRFRPARGPCCADRTATSSPASAHFRMGGSRPPRGARRLPREPEAERAAGQPEPQHLRCETPRVGWDRLKSGSHDRHVHAPLVSGSQSMAASWSLFRGSALYEEVPGFAAEVPVCPNEAHRLKSAPSVAARSVARFDSRIRPCIESWPRRCRRSISARPGAACERFRCSPGRVALPRALQADRP